MQLSFATGNSYKFSELQSYLKRELPSLELQQLKMNIPEIQESDSEKVLRAKMDDLAKQTDEAFIVDDVSFLTERYEGFPGAYAKFINRSLGYEGWKRLFEEGDHISATALVGLHYKNDFHVFRGEIKGILSFKRGNTENSNAPLNDIIFLPELGCFLGEALKKNDFKNHRMLSLDKLVEFMKTVERAE
jgi:XTP/dITP diphosphohydrolase